MNFVIFDALHFSKIKINCISQRPSDIPSRYIILAIFGLSLACHESMHVHSLACYSTVTLGITLAMLGWIYCRLILDLVMLIFGPKVLYSQYSAKAGQDKANPHPGLAAQHSDHWATATGKSWMQ